MPPMAPRKDHIPLGVVVAPKTVVAASSVFRGAEGVGRWASNEGDLPFIQAWP